MPCRFGGQTRAKCRACVRACVRSPAQAGTPMARQDGEMLLLITTSYRSTYSTVQCSTHDASIHRSAKNLGCHCTRAPWFEYISDALWKSTEPTSGERLHCFAKESMEEQHHKSTPANCAWRLMTKNLLPTLGQEGQTNNAERGAKRRNTGGHRYAKAVCVITLF